MGDDAGLRYQAGRGVADITGEAAGCGMLGYGKAAQQTQGIHLRLRARAFVIVDEPAGGRVLIVVCELGLMFDSIHREVLRRLGLRYGDLYDEQNVMLTVTHTHCGPGGYGHHRLYNLTIRGFRQRTFDAVVDGILEAVDAAHADLAPSTLRLAHGTLHNASTNRSLAAFELNPAADRETFPAAVDPQTTTLAIERAEVVEGVINWFATHGTSMTNQNTLISSDNKGYAAYHWEREVAGVDYRGDDPPSFVAAFAQTNAGDMSPNLGRAPGSGPTDDEVENTRIIGIRQYDAAAALLHPPPPPVDGAIEARLVYVDMGDTETEARLAPDGRPHHTSGPTGGAAALAGTAEGRGLLGFRQGWNPLWDRLSAVAYRCSPRLRDAQAPKAAVLPGGLLNRIAPFVQQRVPVQLLRVGTLYLLGIPGEVTIVAGLRLRRAVAAVVGAEVSDVLVAGYCNGYLHYVTTPEEYDAQRYEGGSTLFGRWELLVLQQAVERLARAMRDGAAVDPGPPPADAAPRRSPRPRTVADEIPPGCHLGETLVDARASYLRGETVSVAFVGRHPANDLRRGGTYLEVQRQEPDLSWRTLADDGDWSTTFRWSRIGRTGSRVTITWSTALADAGTYRIHYLPTAAGADSAGTVSSSAPFRVVGGLPAETSPDMRIGLSPG